jgi:Uri superfamily endonuclease
VPERKQLDKRRVQAKLPAVGGTYVLIFHAQHEDTVKIGSLGDLKISPGYYLYIGSAFGSGGLRARVGRHALRRKPLRWHIDYLAKHLTLVGVFYSQDPERHEQAWARSMGKNDAVDAPMPGFGASDRPGETHLYFSARKPVKAFFSPLSCEHRVYLA